MLRNVSGTWIRQYLFPSVGFDELAGAFRERGDVLTASLDQSSQLGDRLNMFLSNLTNALDQLRAQEPPSCRPPVLRRQLAECLAIFELLRQKEPSLAAMKAQCQEQLVQARSEQAMAEMQQRLAELDHHWMELRSGAEFRQKMLEALLPVAKHFWLQLDTAQQAIGQCRQQCDLFGTTTALESGNQNMEQQLQQRHAQMQHLQSVMGECAGAVQQAHLQGMDFCGRLVNAEEEQNFVQQHLAALQAQWDAFLVHHAQLSGSLNAAMDQVILD